MDKRKRTKEDIRIRQMLGKVLSFSARMDKIEADLRKAQSELKKCELRDQQMILMFKMILDKSLGRVGVRNPTMKELANFMNSLVSKNMCTNEAKVPLETDVDLVAELIKKSA